MTRAITADPNINGYFRSLSLEGKKWMYYTQKVQLNRIKDVFESDIRPHLSEECNNIKLLEIKNSFELRIKYQRICGKSLSSINRTISFIQDELRKKVFSDLMVVPV